MSRHTTIKVSRAAHRRRALQKSGAALSGILAVVLIVSWSIRQRDDGSDSVETSMQEVRPSTLSAPPVTLGKTGEPSGSPSSSAKASASPEASKSPKPSGTTSRAGAGSIGAKAGRTDAEPTERVLNAYYVDCNSGSDSAGGRSQDSAWRSLPKERSFNAGDALYLKRGCTWDNGLVVRGEGTAETPILIAAYGTGSSPHVRNPGSGEYGVGIDVTGAYTIVDGVTVSDVPFTGVHLRAPHGVVRNSEFYDTGFGVVIDGDNGLVTHNEARDLKMIKNTEGGNDDYGAVGFTINADGVEISYNRCENCQGPSYDYGSDGGFVEIWNRGDNAFIHHNHARDTNGFLEAGAEDSSKHANNVRVAYNVIENCSISININRQNLYGISVHNFRFENNTVVQTEKGYPVVIFPSVTPESFISRNNIIYLSGSSLYTWYGTGSFTRKNNLYFVSAGARVNHGFGPGEKLGNPKFRNPARGDYRPAAGSPADNAGVHLGYTHDLNGKVIGSLPSIGALEP